jgi:catechol 2,3-dioxygenase
MAVKIESLGHVVLGVEDVERAERFYSGVLGLPVCARMEQNGPRMVFFSLGDHHDFAVMEIGPGASRPTGRSVGLQHVAFKIGTTLEALKEAHATLTAAGVKTVPIDHEVTQSLYFADPDGNGLELYVDTNDVWRREPQRVAQIRPLALDT